jgi:hypothetical protein
MMNLINRPLVQSDGELSDRSHIPRDDDSRITLCGERSTRNVAPMGMQVCLRCLIQACRNTITHYENQIAKGEY